MVGRTLSADAAIDAAGDTAVTITGDTLVTTTGDAARDAAVTIAGDEEEEAGVVDADVRVDARVDDRQWATQTDL